MDSSDLPPVEGATADAAADTSEFVSDLTEMEPDESPGPADAVEFDTTVGVSRIIAPSAADESPLAGMGRVDGSLLKYACVQVLWLRLQCGRNTNGTCLCSRMRGSRFTRGVWFLLHYQRQFVVVSPVLYLFRHGDDMEQSHLMGIAQALMSTGDDMEDSLKYGHCARALLLFLSSMQVVMEMSQEHERGPLLTGVSEQAWAHARRVLQQRGLLCVAAPTARVPTRTDHILTH